MLPVFKHPDFDDDAFSYGFFGRKGGVSEDIYAYLNCGFGSDDVREAIFENRSRVAKALGSKQQHICGPYQVHSNRCVKISSVDQNAERPEADAVVTNLPNLPISVLTADCVPVLFHVQTPSQKVIGAAHAGWRGALSAVLQETVKMMCSYSDDIQPNMISACVGPCITKKSYQVDEQFRISFLNQSSENKQYFADDRDDRYLFDLPSYCVDQLSILGVSKISVIDEDTYTQPDTFFSFRRSTHDGTAKQGYGRQISAIMIKG